MSSHLRLIFVWLSLGLGSLLLGWGVWPAGQNIHVLNLPRGTVHIPALENQSLTLQLESPRWVRPGDVVTLRLRFMSAGEHPLAVQATAALFTARLELTGMEVQPATPISQPLLPGKTLVFYWKASVLQAGLYTGRLWCRVEEISLGDSQSHEQTIAALPLRMEAKSWLGLSGRTARWSGTLLLLIGLGFSIPFSRYKHSRPHPGALTPLQVGSQATESIKIQPPDCVVRAEQR